ncbi:SRPBCC family protein, partial [Dactylosporangium roseum]
QWTEFEDIPRFTKKVEKVEREQDEKLHWRAQIFLSHRDWDAQIVEMVPDERIVWRSKGAKGYPDGAISFHALTPTLTRVVLIIEYHPKGFFEQTGNLWRAQGRRARPAARIGSGAGAGEREGPQGRPERGEGREEHERGARLFLIGGAVYLVLWLYGMVIDHGAVRDPALGCRA